MSSQSIQTDAFLKKKQIEIERSQFLSNHFAAKSFNLRQSYDPKDIHGMRMSSYWKQGDTIISVIIKKIKENLKTCLDPDTFSKNKLISVKQALIKDKLNVFAFLLVILVPTVIAHPIIKPRMNAIRRQMIFQYYLQAGMISRQLKSPMTKIPKQQMQKIINKANQKIGF